MTAADKGRQQYGLRPDQEGEIRVLHRGHAIVEKTAQISPRVISSAIYRWGMGVHSVFFSSCSNFSIIRSNLERTVSLPRTAIKS